MPVIETGVGNVHVYVDASADLDMAERIVVNSKTSRVSVCNSAETLLVHRAVADEFLPRITAALQSRRGGGARRRRSSPRWTASSRRPTTTGHASTSRSTSPRASSTTSTRRSRTSAAGRPGTPRRSSRATSTPRAGSSRGSTRAAVMVNASTRFTDGGEFGFGAEIGISTQKMHARGPMGLAELTSTKWVVTGDGQVR